LSISLAYYITGRDKFLKLATKSERENDTAATFYRIEKWFNNGIFNWESTDALYMLVL